MSNRKYGDAIQARLTLPQACLLGTLNATGGRVRKEGRRYRVVVVMDDCVLTSLCHASTLSSLAKRRLINLDRKREGWVITDLGRACLNPTTRNGNE